MGTRIGLGATAAGVEIGEAAELALQSIARVGVIIAATALAWRLVRRLLGRIDDQRNREQMLFFVPKVIGLAAIVLSIAAVGIDVSGMAAIMTTVGFTGAVVFTPVGQNFVAGAMIRIDDLYHVGEAVTINELHGKVVHRSLLRTELELPDGSKAWVPNSLFHDSEVMNHSRMGGWRICVQVPLDRASDRLVAERIMNDVIARLTWNSRGKQPFVAFDHIGAEAMFFHAYAWIEDRTQEPYYRGLLLSDLVNALEADGVSVGQTTNLAIAQDRHAPRAALA